VAEKQTLRDYQLDLSARLQRAGTDGSAATKLGLEAAGAAWLVDLVEAGEMIPVLPISTVPLARPWFRGVSNIRGNLYSVTDFAAFLGGEATAVTDQARLLLISDRFSAGCALLVGRSLGLRRSDEMELRPRGSEAKWTRAVYTDAEGKQWKELDVPALVRDPEFLDVSV
jgi:twitching motility protein PilI